MGTGGHTGTITDTDVTMPTEDAVLTLAQWLSPAYPVGAFAYSHGLERAVEAGRVHDVESLEAWLRDVLEHGSGHSDVLFLTAAWQAESCDEVAAIDAIARAFAPSRERLMETDLTGAAFCEVTGAVWEADLAELCYPVAVGHAAWARDLPLGLTAQMYLQAFMANLVAAGMRLLPVGQTAGQALIRRLTPLCTGIAEAAQGETLDDLSATAFLADIASMQHETQHSRIFRT
jgi:urease accessory protein